ncbi:AAA family ATPase [Leucobacter luti]|uniref:AAA domain-containing protein n=1 Tax=Leucobacter luti TaxID=340320 RepID=A0A4Q7THQ0_9MICO|nr:AAA family ATPase [Leucobacter luti]MBL3699691.1 ATP-binding protein [Leucobacter luti]RZT59467.1 AAA domain-containing protein [Leucobacter luti]
MRDATSNPFTPGSDTVPEVWAGRVDQQSDWERVLKPRLLAGLNERGRTITGEPGLGKSTLVRRIAAAAAAEGAWVTPQVRLPIGTDPLKAVAAAVLHLADLAGLAASRERRITDILGRVRQVAASGISLTIDRVAGPEPYTALTELLEAVGTAAIRDRTVVIIHIDEIQNVTNEHALSQLLISLGDAITTRVPIELPGGVLHERALPLAVYLTGLPEFAEKASSRTGATFARRFASTTLVPISDDDFRLALAPFTDPGWEVRTGEGAPARVRMTSEAAEKLVELCRGEPFLFQLAGERAWYAGQSAVITLEDVLSGWDAAKHEATAHVERILDRLPAKEREFVETLAAAAPELRTATGIAKSMGYATAASVGPFAQRLDTVRGIVQRGRRYSFRHRALEAYLTTEWPETGTHE